MALDVSEKYESKQLEISVAFRQSKHGELYNVTCIYCVCVCVCVCVYTHITLQIFSALMYILVCLYVICVCVECKIQSPPQHKTIHPKGMEVVANAFETCDKEAG